MRRFIGILAILVFRANFLMAAFASIGTIGTSVTATGDPCVFTVDAGGAAQGNLVVVGVVTTNILPSLSVTDSKGNIYYLLGTASRTGLSADIYGSTLDTALLSGDTISADFAGSQTVSVGAWEWSGIQTTPEVDVSSTGSRGTAIDVPIPAPVNTLVVNDLVVIITAYSAAGTLDNPVPTNYTAGPLETANAPAFYMPYSIIAGLATRQWSTAQWTGGGANVATVNLGIKIAKGTVSLRHRNSGFMRR